MERELAVGTATPRRHPDARSDRSVIAEQTSCRRVRVRILYQPFSHTGNQPFFPFYFASRFFCTFFPLSVFFTYVNIRVHLLCDVFNVIPAFTLRSMFPNRLYDTFIPSPFPALVEFPVLSTTTTRTPRDVHRFVVLSRHPFRPSSSLLASLPLPRESILPTDFVHSPILLAPSSDSSPIIS